MLQFYALYLSYTLFWITVLFYDRIKPNQVEKYVLFFLVNIESVFMIKYLYLTYVLSHVCQYQSSYQCAHQPGLCIICDSDRFHNHCIINL